MNSEYYKGLLERLRNDVRRKRPEKWANGFSLHHNNTPWATVPHIASGTEISVK